MTNGDWPDASVARSVSRRLVITLLAVPAILVGLLAMHVLAGAEELAASSMGMSVTTTPATPSAMTDGNSPDCAGPCLTSVDMTMSMACVLALLVTIIMLTVLVTVGRRNPELLHRLLSLWRARIASLPPSIPPSLLILSISRI